MCGISGVIINNNVKDDELKEIVYNMISKISYRGPDRLQIWADCHKKVAFGHARLSIIDPSPLGDQPMKSFNDRFIITFNGEIYNHLQIRNYLKQKKSFNNWKSFSDTETLINSIAILGLEKTLEMAEGMFAFGLYDKDQKNLILARDRFGEKPLYYGWINQSFIFASELKSIKAFPNFNQELDKAALSNYFQKNYIPCPQSIYKGIFKLEPGSFINLNLDKYNNTGKIEKTKFWSLKKIILKSKDLQYSCENDLLSDLNLKIKKSVQKQLISDVSLGVFMSGGIDSTLIASIAQELSPNKLDSFTVGFEKSSYDESPYARKISKHLNLSHNELIVKEIDAQNVIPDLPEIYDEPFADSSQIPTYLLSKFAKKKITVALSGDGGDELFGGYNRYIIAPNIWKKINYLPKKIQKPLLNLLLSTPVDTIEGIFKLINFLLNKKTNFMGSRMHRVANRIKENSSLYNFCEDFSVEWKRKDNLLLEDDITFYSDLFNADKNNEIETLDPVSKMIYKDTLTYLPDDILCKVDRASMFNSLEVRCPFLCNSIIDIAWKTPLKMKIKNKIGKLPLRSLLYQYVPKDLVDRPKAGFAIPISEWLRGPLKEWAHTLLSEKSIKDIEFLNFKTVKKTWELHLTGKYDFTPKLWSILMLQSWLKQNKK